MKFGDKLTQLRKRNGFSQEELGEKLNVTRQTVSKWELGQSKPDTDKLMEISKLLNVDFNTLADDTMAIEGIKPNNIVDSDEVRPRKWLLVLLIIIAIVIVIVLTNKFITDKKTADKENKNGIFDFFGIFEKIEEKVSGQNKDSFNWDYETNAGTKWGTLVSDLLDDIIKNNKTNKEHTITVIFDDLNSSDPNLIKESKKKLKEWDDYEVSLDYDDNGFVDMVTIEYLEEETETNVNIDNNNNSNTSNTQTHTESNSSSTTNSSSSSTNTQTHTESSSSSSSISGNTPSNSGDNNLSNDFDKKSFNMRFEFYSGTEKGAVVSSLLDTVITSNKKNSSHIVKVVYNGTTTSDENEIRNMKNSFDTWTDYEVTLDYDGNGYVSSVTIK